MQIQGLTDFRHVTYAVIHKNQNINKSSSSEFSHKQWDLTIYF
jgi:hypothetical protein